MFSTVYPGLLAAAISICVLCCGTSGAADLEVFPPDNHTVIDSTTGVELTYLTWTSDSRGNYFHQRSFFPDGSLIILKSSRGLMGYIVATGELVDLDGPAGRFRDRATVAATRNSVFAIRGHDIVELSVELHVSDDPAVRSRAIGEERVIASVDGWCRSGCAKLNGNYDDRYLVTYNEPYILRIEIDTGEVVELAEIGPPIEWHSHVQFSRGPSNLISFAGGSDWHEEGDPPRLWLLDPDTGEPRVAHQQVPGELVTHESWWVDDQILFCGAPPAIAFEGEPTKREMSHVSVLDPVTGVVRIIGAGSWWPGGTDAEIWKRNWWHCAGSDDGAWVVADTFHGDLVLFDGKTSRPRLLTTGHRTYGGGEHAHPGFDPTGRYVIFSANVDGGGRACIARIPDEWRDD